MKGAGTFRVRPGRLAVAALLAVGAVALLLALGSPDPSSAGGGKARAVGEVVAVTGNVSGLYVTPDGGRRHRLESGDTLRLGDVIDPDQGVQATLRLERPTGLSGDPDLVSISPGKGDEHTVTLERTGKRTTIVTISD